MVNLDDNKECGGNGSARVRVRVKRWKHDDLEKRYREARDAIWRELLPRPAPSGWLFDPRDFVSSQPYRCPACGSPAGHCFHVTCHNPALPSVGAAMPVRGFAGLRA